MDWKRLVQFALLGSSDLEQYAILLVRVSIGLFFAISGANKLFVAGGVKPVYETLVQAKVPFPHQMAYFVSGVADNEHTYIEIVSYICAQRDSASGSGNALAPVGDLGDHPRPVLT